jgi:glutamyl-tRNA synthetase
MRLIELIIPRIEEALKKPVNDIAKSRLFNGISSLKIRAKTLSQLVDLSLFYCRDRPLVYTHEAAQIIDPDTRLHLRNIEAVLTNIHDWTQGTIEKAIKVYANTQELKLARIAQPLRAALTGATSSPGIFEVATVLGKEETLGRIADAAVRT